jgi:hypothetical protein
VGGDPLRKAIEKLTQKTGPFAREALFGAIRAAVAALIAYLIKSLL